MPKKKSKVKLVFLVVLAFAVALGLSYAISYKMTVDDLMHKNTPPVATGGDAIPSDDEETSFEMEKLELEDIFSSAKTVELTADSDVTLVCLNRNNKITRDYEPMLAKLEEGEDIYLLEEAAEAFEKMYAAAKEADVTLTPIDGYAGFDRQNRRFEYKVNELCAKGMSIIEAEEEAANTVLPAGHSEQYLGLIVWIGSADETFGSSDAYIWLKNHADEYGFIERYPYGKNSSTGMDYMPWVWRYVGTKAASTISGSGLSLEEYTD